MRAAAGLDDATEKHPVTPGSILPAREQLGELLIELKRPQEALTELEAVMKKEPNRFRTLAQGARAASAAGNQESARKYYAALVTMCPKGDDTRRELVEARTQLK
jgi:predicted Zn-dependent protease